MSSVPTPSETETAPNPDVETGSGAAMSWQRQLAAAIRDPRALLARLGLSAADVPEAGVEAGLPAFPLLAPLSFVRRMQPGNPADPLLRQVLPTSRESEARPGFVPDPVGDAAARSAPGLLHKYHGRALLITTGACAVHCRYCFRREYPYQHDPRRIEDWEPALAALARDQTITEVILSGGDPLMLTDDRLEQLLHRLDVIDHVERLRIHTRLPIVLPARITDRLLSLLLSLRCQPMVVVHANHGNEIAADCRQALQRMVRQGLPVLNQAVLLNHINDTTEAMEELCRRLINIGVIPYYLHQLDRVTGVGHFETTDATGRRIVEELARRLPGYAVPRFVREVPGATGKTPI
ncbi:MAG: EF-P beta-lysylation protein EpmB [Fuerstiella sp.]